MAFFWLTVEYFYQKYIYEQNYRTPFSSPHPKSEKSGVRNCIFLCFVAKNRKIGTFWLFGAPHARRAHRQGAEKTRACAGCVTATNQFRMIALCDGDILFSVSSLIQRFFVKFYSIFSFLMLFERKNSFFFEIFTYFQQKRPRHWSHSTLFGIFFKLKFLLSFLFFVTAKVIFNFFFLSKKRWCELGEPLVMPWVFWAQRPERQRAENKVFHFFFCRDKGVTTGFFSKAGFLYFDKSILENRR